MSLHFVSGKQQTAVLHKVYLYFIIFIFCRVKLPFGVWTYSCAPALSKTTSLKSWRKDHIKVNSLPNLVI